MDKESKVDTKEILIAIFNKRHLLIEYASKSQSNEFRAIILLYLLPFIIFCIASLYDNNEYKKASNDVIEHQQKQNQNKQITILINLLDTCMEEENKKSSFAKERCSTAEAVYSRVFSNDPLISYEQTGLRNHPRLKNNAQSRLVDIEKYDKENEDTYLHKIMIYLYDKIVATFLVFLSLSSAATYFLHKKATGLRLYKNFHGI